MKYTSVWEESPTIFDQTRIFLTSLILSYVGRDSIDKSHQPTPPQA